MSTGNWTADTSQFLGKRVEITLDENVVTIGILLGFSEGGAFEIQEDDGFIHYCWPMLQIRGAS